MGSKLDLYKKYFDESSANPPSSTVEANEKYLSDGFQAFDKEGNVAMDKNGWVGMSNLLYASFDDFKFVYSDMHEEEDGVIVTGHFEGTHTRDLDLSAMGMGVIPASGKRVVWPETSNLFKVEGGKIVNTQDVGENGGIEAFMKALGVTLPNA